MQKFLIRGEEAKRENEITQEMILAKQLNLEVSKDKYFRIVYKKLRSEVLSELKDPNQRKIVLAVNVLYKRSLVDVNILFSRSMEAIGKK